MTNLDAKTFSGPLCLASFAGATRAPDEGFSAGAARGEEAGLHFEVERARAEHLGYRGELPDAIPAAAPASFAGVEHPLDLATLRPGEAVLDLGSGSGTDVFCAAMLVSRSGRVVGVDITPEQLEKAARLRDRDGFLEVELVEAYIEQLPFEDASSHAAFSSGVTNRSPLKHRASAEAAGVERPGGRLAIANIDGRRALSGRATRDVELWAARIAGAISDGSYPEALEARGLHARELRRNDHRCISERALDAGRAYGVERSPLLACKPSGVARLTSRPDAAGDADVTRAAAGQRLSDGATAGGSAAGTHRSAREGLPTRLVKENSSNRPDPTRRSRWRRGDGSGGLLGGSRRRWSCSRWS